jgi:hypothetical protein
MAGIPPNPPGTMTPVSKDALGQRLGLDSPPPVLSGAGVVPDGDLSSVNVAEVSAQLADAYSDIDGYEGEARDIILTSPAGSSASEGYHLSQQSDVINDQGHLDVGPVPERPPQERA